mmetsp:Transcript_45683/g.145864  ORF Transcript_45683/g.145864 Transcript_45683/m.145864 type:complete len:201 (+) Transcript_45683:1578-2180(+)
MRAARDPLGRRERGALHGPPLVPRRRERHVGNVLHGIRGSSVGLITGILIGLALVDLGGPLGLLEGCRLKFCLPDLCGCGMLPAPKVAHEEVQEEALPRAVCAHDRDNGDRISVGLHQIAADDLQVVIVHHDTVFLHVQAHDLQRPGLSLHLLHRGKVAGHVGPLASSARRPVLQPPTHAGWLRAAGCGQGPGTAGGAML